MEPVIQVPVIKPNQIEIFAKYDFEQKGEVSLDRLPDLNSTKTIEKQNDEDGLEEFCCLEQAISRVEEGKDVN